MTAIAAFDLRMLLGIAACAAQHADWTGHVQRIVATCDALLDETNGRLAEAKDDATDLLRRAQVAELCVDTLTADLAQAHRANTLLRTGILDAEREANAMAEVLDLPIDLAERRSAR